MAIVEEQSAIRKPAVQSVGEGARQVHQRETVLGRLVTLHLRDRRGTEWRVTDEDPADGVARGGIGVAGFIEPSAGEQALAQERLRRTAGAAVELDHLAAQRRRGLVP